MKAQNRLLFLPAPRQFETTGDVFLLTAGRLILLDSESPQMLRFAVRHFQEVLAERCGLSWEMVASRATPADLIGLTLRVAADQVGHPQGYEVTVSPGNITITGHDVAGVFYGVCTVIQLLEVGVPTGASVFMLPTLHISDWPDFSVRGVMLDISRDKVPTMETMLALVDLLTGWKINQLQLYTEHTFAYRNHPEVWATASPFTGDEILTLDAYCRERHIELVPNQNSFGHMERWLKHPRYAALAEVNGPITVPWGIMEGPFSLAPGDSGSLRLLQSLYDELLPHYSSRQFNVGCDETFDVGQGRSKEAVMARGAGRVYLDFLLQIYREVTAHGRTMQFWGDIIINHPELISELPRDLVALEWGYQAEHPFDAHGEKFAASGIPFYVCPGTSSWCSIAGRTDNALGNLLSAAENGLRHGAGGYLNTDWGDYGHWQVLPVSYLGLAGGAAYSWALEANRNVDIAEAISRFAFRDTAGAMGRVAYDLGNVYRAVGIEPFNASALFLILRSSFEELRGYQNHAPVPPGAFEQALPAIDRAIVPLGAAPSARSDAALIQREFSHTVRLLRHACRRGIVLMAPGVTRSLSALRELDQDLCEILEEYRWIWLARNRPGGLVDSAAKLERVRQDYRAA